MRLVEGDEPDEALVEGGDEGAGDVARGSTDIVKIGEADDSMHRAYASETAERQARQGRRNW